MSRPPPVALLVAGALAAGCGGRDAAPADAGSDARIVLEDAGPRGDGGMAPAGDPPLPAWFDRARVHGHTHLWKVLAGTPEFGFAATGFAEMGATVFSRHVKTGSEDPWWPSALPVIDGSPALAGEPDLVAPMADSASAAGLHVVGYYWHAADERLATLHPEWVCRTADGAPASSGRGLHLDLTGAYGEVVETRLSELAARGMGGVYLDQHHLPPEGCFGTALEEAFATETGLLASEHLHDYLVFSGERAAARVAGWRRRLAADFPEAVLIASASDLPGLTLAHARVAAAAAPGSPKTELHLALEPGTSGGVFEDGALPAPPDDVRMAFGWALLRDAADGRPPHVWAPGLPSREHALGFVAAVASWGGVASLDVDDTLVLRDMGASPHETAREVLFEAMAWGQRISAALGGARPLRFAAVHFPEAARDGRAGDHARAWREVLWPATGAFEALMRARVPAGVVTDGQLAAGALEGYGVLILPAPSELSPAQRASVEAFRAAGGAVIEVDGAPAWADPAGLEAARAALAAALAEPLGRAPVRATGGPSTLVVVPFERPDGAVVVALAQGLGWVQTHGESAALDPSEVRPAPPPAPGVQLELRLGRPVEAAVDALDGAPLTATPGPEGTVTVALPPVAILSLVELRLR